MSVCGECVYACTYVLLSGATEMRARSLPSHPFSLPPPPLTLASVPLLLPPAHRNTCSLLGSHYRGPACILGKDFTVRGHRLLLSNKQSGTSGCPWTHSPAPPSLLILSRPHHYLPNVHPAQFLPISNPPFCSRALTAVVPCKFYMIGISLSPPACLSPAPHASDSSVISCCILMRSLRNSSSDSAYRLSRTREFA